MVKIYDQLSLFQSYQECKDAFQNDKPKFLQLLTEHLDLASIIPGSFFYSYYKNLGRNREYSLLSMLSALLIQKILGIPTISLLINILTLSRELREFCGFNKVPDCAQFTRFKQTFVNELETFFDHLVDLTESICQKIDPVLASTIAFDTSGIEPYVTENNPKFINSIIKNLKSYYKNKPDVDIYKMAYGLMPSHAFKNEEVKQLYINGCFCYAYKFAIITNGLGIPRNITMLDNEFKNRHPELPIDKKSDSPDEDKSISDSKALKPVMNDFYKMHPESKYDNFLGDSSFDSHETYRYLMKDMNFKKVFIPINQRNTNIDIPPVQYNENGWPLCSSDPSVPLKPCGWTRENGREDRFKWMCPLVKRINGKWKSSCENPCNGKPCGRVTYTSPNQDIRMYPGVIRGSEEWIDTYKIRVVIEKNIQYLKEPLACGNLKTINKKTIKADLYLAGISQLITLMLADSMDKHKYIRSLKPLIKTA